MTLWIAFALMAALAVGFVVLPLFRRPSDEAAPRRADYDLTIYKDQLREVERDRARGVIDESQAAAARIEVERRLLAAAASAGAAHDPAPPAATRRGAAWSITLVVALVLLPGAALVYLHGGAPWLAERAQRTAASDSAVELADLLAQMERHLAASPNDRRGWTLLARGYLRAGREAEAQAAQRRAMALTEDDSEAADIAAGFGQVLTEETRGQVTSAARDAFAEALTRNPRQPQARYFLALAKLQDGDGASALADWQALLDDTPPDAPWRAGLEERVTQLSRELASGDDTQAQQAMIESMVAGLAERLAALRESGGGSAEEWAKLGLSYRVLGRAAQARDAYGEAVKRAPEDVALLREHATAVTAADGEGSPAHRAALAALRDRLPMGSTERATIEDQLKR